MLDRTPKKHFIQPTTIKNKSILYDPVFIDIHSWSYNEEVALRENNERALDYFKKKFRDKIMNGDKNKEKEGEKGIIK